MAQANDRDAKEQRQLNEELNEYKTKILNAKNDAQRMSVVQDVLKAMSAGREVQSLFSDMVSMMTTKDMKLKKLIYIFLISNASTNQDFALMCVNALVLDSQDRDSAMFRALAVRAMGSVVTPMTIDFVTGPVVQACTDKDPFVRKCAATSLAKLFTINSENFVNNNMAELLHKLLRDGNQAVVAAATGALIRVAEECDQVQLQEIIGVKSLDEVFNAEEIQIILTVIQQAAEWQILTLIQAISKYGVLPDVETADIIVQRLEPYLKYSNQAVALATINCFIRYIYGGVLQPALNASLRLNCITAMISMVSQTVSNETLFIVLRAFRLAIHVFAPDPSQLAEFARQSRLFYVRYAEDLCVKIEKVEILSAIATDENAVDIIAELQDYSKDIAPEFVRTAIRAIGTIACRLSSVANLCVQVFQTLLTGIDANEQPTNFILPSYAAQELLIAVQSIFRKYPNEYERIIGVLCECITNYENKEAKASLIWIIGEYSSAIDGSDQIIQDLMGMDAAAEQEGTFSDDGAQVQLAVITAVYKIFVTVGQPAMQLLQFVNALADRQKSPDIRQRARYLMRLVQMDPTMALAQSVILVQKPSPVFSDGLSDEVKLKMAKMMGSIPSTLREIFNKTKLETEDRDEVLQRFNEVEVIEEAEPVQSQQYPQQLQQQQQQYQQQIPVQAKPADPMADLFDFGGAAPVAPAPVQQQRPTASADPMADLFGMSSPAAPVQQQPTFNAAPVQQQQQQQQQQQPQIQQMPFPVARELPIRPKDAAQPLKLRINFTRGNGEPQLLMAIKNDGQTPIQAAKFQFNPNAFGLEVDTNPMPMIPAMCIYDGGNYINVPIRSGSNVSQVNCGQADPKLQSGLGTLVFSINPSNTPPMHYMVRLPIYVFFSENGTFHRNKSLVDVYQATMQCNAAHGGFPETKFQGVFPGNASQLMSFVGSANFHFVKAEESQGFFDTVSYVQLCGSSRAVYVRWFYRPGGNGIEVMASVRAAPVDQIITSFVADSIQHFLFKF